MVRNNPIRCAAEGCAFYAVVFGGYCEDCEIEAFSPVSESGWILANFEQISQQNREHFWEHEAD
jgi:hypothetical protein